MKHIVTTTTAGSIANGATAEQAGRKEVMKIRNNAERGFTLIEIVFALAVMVWAAPNSSAATISSIFQDNLVEYLQTSAAQPTPSSARFAFEAQIIMQNVGNFTAGNVALPGGLQPTNGTNNGASPDMFLPGSTQLIYESPLLAQAAYNAEFPNGIYTYTATGSPSQTVTLNQTSQAYPTSIPFISDFASLQGMNTANPFTVTWNSFAGALSGTCSGAGTTCSLVSFDVFGNNANVFAFESQPNSTTSVTIPANTLAPNTAYDFRLTFENFQVASPASGITVFAPEFFTLALTSGTFTTGPAIPEPCPAILSMLGLGIVAAYRLCVFRIRLELIKR